MAKRFIEQNFFKDPFVRGLPSPLRSFYIYLILECNNGGLWDVEIDVARLRCGIPESISDKEIVECFSDKIIILENGDKWFVKNFVKVQHKGELNMKNKAHKNFISELLKYDILTEIEEGIFVLKEENSSPLTSPLTRNGLGSKVKVKVKEEGKGKSKGKGKKAEIEKKSELVLPWESETFKTQWQHWKIYKKKEFDFKYKSNQSEQAALHKLSNLSGGSEGTAIKIIHEAMSNGWKGFFKLKNETNGKENRNSKSNTEIARNAASSEIGRNYRTQ